MRVMALVVLPLAMTLGGCATIAHGTTQAVPITSSPQGARVFVDSDPSRRDTARRDRLAQAISRRLDRPRQLSASSRGHGSQRVTVAPRQPVLLRCPRDCRLVERRGLWVSERYAACRSLRGAGAGTAPSRRIPTGSVATAAVLTGLFGLGSGQRVLGVRAWPFFVTQFAGGTMVVTGLGMGFAGQRGGEALFTTGVFVVFGSRVWEIADLISVTSERNRVVAAGGSAPTAHHRDVSLVPVVDARSKGVALRFGF